MGKKPQISDAEWEVMKVLWSRSPVSVNEVAEALTAKEWHPKTIRTMLARLSKKGVVAHKVHDGIYRYYPLLTKEECERTASDWFLDRVFDGALAPMVAHIAKRRRLTADERKELERILEEDES
ncbi:MAG: BlaI/MecI/CopY family transcriptional regulator [Candidatus Hydrogenedentes bacterium]|nr:BlaI/MecI/CopY family transcriptional regulator [Candidatus Hydrogenedentota bacterium]